LGSGVGSMDVCLNSVEGSYEQTEVPDEFGWSLGSFSIDILCLILAFAEAMYMTTKSLQAIIPAAGLICSCVGMALSSFSLAGGNNWVSKYAGYVGLVISLEVIGLTTLGNIVLGGFGSAEGVAWYILTMFFSGTAAMMGLKGAGYL